MCFDVNSALHEAACSIQGIQNETFPRCHETMPGVTQSCLWKAWGKCIKKPWKGTSLKGKFTFQPSIFRAYLSFHGGYDFFWTLTGTAILGFFFSKAEKKRKTKRERERVSDSLRWSKKTLRTNVPPLIGGHSRPSVLMAHPLQVFSQMFSTWSTSRTDKWRKHSKVEKTSKLCFCSELLTKAEWIWNIRFILAGICSLQMEPTMANHNFITCRRRCLITISVSFKKASMRWRGELNNWMYKTLSKNYNDWASLTFSPNQALVSRNGIPYLGSSATTTIAAIPTTYLLVACWASHFSASSWPLPVETTMSSASASQHQPQDWHQPQRHPEKLQLIQLSRKIKRCSWCVDVIF